MNGSTQATMMMKLVMMMAVVVVVVAHDKADAKKETKGNKSDCGRRQRDKD